jgi:toxin secretion/phage lysis holin
MENLRKALFAVVGSVVAYVYGGWSILLEALFVLILADYATGLIAAAVTGKLSSRVGFKGIARKMMILIMVAVAHIADILLTNSGALAEMGISEALAGGSENNFIMNTAVIFYCVNELISITENAGRSGVKVPSILTRMIEALRSKDENKDSQP